jgi:hypothetical protein
MNTYIIDWGAGADGGRYALIQAKTIKQAIVDADQVGWPFTIAELKIPVGLGIRYMEIDKPRDRYSGAKLSDIKMQDADSWIKDKPTA